MKVSVLKPVVFSTLSQRTQAMLLEAVRQMENARAKYSDYFVGAAIIDENGDIYGGCNMENAAYKGNCGERSATAHMGANGGRIIKEIACATKDGGAPCGDCRQHTWEYANGNYDLPVYTIDESKNVMFATIGELLPDTFVLQ